MSHALGNATARIEYIIHIAGAVIAPDALPEAFTEFLDDAYDGATGDLARSLWPWFDAAMKNEDAAEDEVNEDIAARLWGFPGYLVHVSTPVIMRSGKNGYAYSWGQTWHGYVYAATETDIEPNVAAWAEAKHEADSARSSEAGETP